jgi:hypothetical protein
LNPGAKVIGRKASRVVPVAVPPCSDVARKVQTASASYRTRSKDVAVGVVSGEACARFWGLMIDRDFNFSMTELFKKDDLLTAVIATRW